MNPEPTDHAAELERIVEALKQGEPASFFDHHNMRQAAALLRRQAEEVARLRELVARFEWISDDWGPFCHICDNPRHRGHAPDCRLKAALDAR